MKLKNTSKTIFHDTNRSYSSPLKITGADIKKKLNYFFNGTNIEEVISVSLETKTSLLHITVTTASGVYIGKARLGWAGGLSIGRHYDHPFYGYETIEHFIHDFKASTDDDFRILENYKKQLAKKEKQMKEASEVIHAVSQKHPEYFL